MFKNEFLYNLPEERIALFPVEPRDSCKLLVIHKDKGEIEHRLFSDIDYFLDEGDVIVLNDSKVYPVRSRLTRTSGGIVELLFVRKIGPDTWVALARPSKRLRGGEGLLDDTGNGVVLVTEKQEGHVVLKLLVPESEFFARFGLAPLPAYIERLPDSRDLETYQTVYAHAGFSIAAPTAGLHFTPELLARLEKKGIRIAYIQLDVGEGTFRPIMTDKVEEHQMLSENYVISEEAAEKINGARRVIAVGTTVARTLESFRDEPIKVSKGSTDLFIFPGHEFKHVDVLLTNFHQPGSTPLVLTSAFCGRDLLFKAYAEALSMNYRLLSYGDAMIIIPQKKTSFFSEDPDLSPQSLAEQPLLEQVREPGNKK